MPEHLVFTLTAALAAMGEFAGHERRGTLTWPGRSAVLGLCAAALGLRRDDAEGLAGLDPLRVAVAVLDEGAPLRDFHTVQTVPTAAARRPDSRPAALARAGRSVNTTVTLRDYRAGVLFGVALWDPSGSVSLPRLEAALKRPAFPLYLGRKSCPLAAPPGPRIVEAETVLDALAWVQVPPFRWRWRWLGDGGRVTPGLRLVASDEPLGPDDRRERRNDQLLDRRLWHFASRDLFIRGADGA